MVKVTGLLLSFLGACKMTSVLHEKDASKTRKGNSSKVTYSARSPKTVKEFSIDSSSSSYQTIQIDHITSLSTTGLHVSNDSDQNEAVPDAVEYEIPFGQFVSGKSITTKPDEQQKQNVSLMQKVARLEQELKEMRKEMKHHRKLHCSTLQPQL